jgi:hypothetical protein
MESWGEVGAALARQRVRGSGDRRTQLAGGEGVEGAEALTKLPACVFCFCEGCSG